MWWTVHHSGFVCTVLSILGLCLTPSHCHMKRGGRVYHISRSCRPVCTTQQTCVTFRSHTGAPVARCFRINPHQYHLEGTQLIFKTNMAPIAQPRQQQPHTMVRPGFTTNQKDTDINALKGNGVNPIESTRGQRRFGASLPPHVRTRDFQPSNVVGAPMPIVGERTPTIGRPNNDKIDKALRDTMKVVFGIRPDENSRLVDFRLNGVPARKVDVMLPINNMVNRGVIRTPSDLQGNKIPPRQGKTPPVDPREQGQCASCADTRKCPDNQYCYHSTTCNLMVCQPL